MKNLKLKASFLLVLLFVNSCMITQQKLWGARYYEESFKSFFIDEQNNRVVLIGENEKAYKNLDSYHYYVDNEDIVKVFKLGRKSCCVKLIFYYTEARGSKVLIRDMGLRISKKKLTADEVDFLQKISMTNGKEIDTIGGIFSKQKILRYPASKELTKNYTLTPLSFEKQKDIWEKNTPTQTAGKVLLTPFAIVADILVTPFYFIGTIVTTIGARQ